MTSSQVFQGQPDVMEFDKYDRPLPLTPTRSSPRRRHQELGFPRPSIDSQAIESDTEDEMQNDDHPILSQPKETLILVHFQIEINNGNNFPSDDFLQFSSEPSFAAIIELPQRLTIRHLRHVLEEKLQDILPSCDTSENGPDGNRIKAYPFNQFVLRVGWRSDETTAALASLPIMDINADIDLRESLTVMGMRGWRDHLIAWREFYPRRDLRHTGRLRSDRYDGPNDEPDDDQHTRTTEQKGKYAVGVDSRDRRGKKRETVRANVSVKAREVYHRIRHPLRHRDGNSGVITDAGSNRKLKKTRNHQRVAVGGDSDTVRIRM